jgi:hypothetical protein
MTEFSTAARVGQLRRALEPTTTFPLDPRERNRLRQELDDLEELLRNAR